jgi:transposase-like protein
MLVVSGLRERLDTMSSTHPICRHCSSEDLIRYGIAANGKQEYRCRTCGRQSRENPSAPGYEDARKEEILRAYEERSSIRGIERIFGISRNTLSVWLKKSSKATTLKGNPCSS